MSRAFWIWLIVLAMALSVLGAYSLYFKITSWINAYGVISSILGLLGTIIAIAQVIELRKRAEAIEQEVKNAREDFFRFEHGTVMASCKERLHTIIGHADDNRYEACSVELKYVVADLERINPDASRLFGEKASAFASCLASARSAQATIYSIRSKKVPDGTREQIHQVSNELIVLLGHAISQIRSQ